MIEETTEDIKIIERLKKSSLGAREGGNRRC